MIFESWQETKFVSHHRTANGEKNTSNRIVDRNLLLLTPVYLSEEQSGPAENAVRALETKNDDRTDERLLIKAAQRDPLCFADLYETNFERVYAYIASRVHDRDAAQDLTAEVFQVALANIGSFEWRGVPFVAWLMRIAANAIADRWQRSAKEPPLPDDPLEEQGAESQIERRAMLSELVEALPSDQRHVVIRRFVDQRSIREIAQEMRRSEGAVKQLQFRALQTLRSSLVVADKSVHTKDTKVSRSNTKENGSTE